MKVLKSLTFGVMSRGSQNPVLARRAKLIHRLEQQKRLAQDAELRRHGLEVASQRSGEQRTRSTAKAGTPLVA